MCVVHPTFYHIVARSILKYGGGESIIYKHDPDGMRIARWHERDVEVLDSVLQLQLLIKLKLGD